MFSPVLVAARSDGFLTGTPFWIVDLRGACEVEGDHCESVG
jgi:hypothetical protein